MNDAEKMKECPFCKSKDYDPVCDQNDDGSWFVGCLAHQEGGCGVHMGDFTSKEHAIAAWNTRSAPPVDVVAVPKSALDWLYGAGPDANGQWFNETYDDELNYDSAFNRKTGKYWWRRHFRKLIEAAPPEATAMMEG